MTDGSPTDRTPAAAPGSTAPTHPQDPSIGDLVGTISSSVSSLVQGEIELAKLELTASVKNLGVGAGAFIGAAVLAVFALTFGFVALAEGLTAAGLDRWLAYLVVFLLLIAVAGLLVFVGIRKVKRVRAPEQTIATTKQTVEYLKTSRG